MITETLIIILIIVILAFIFTNIKTINFNSANNDVKNDNDVISEKVEAIPVDDPFIIDTTLSPYYYPYLYDSYYDPYYYPFWYGGSGGSWSYGTTSHTPRLIHGGGYRDGRHGGHTGGRAGGPAGGRSSGHR